MNSMGNYSRPVKTSELFNEFLDLVNSNQEREKYKNDFPLFVTDLYKFKYTDQEKFEVRPFVFYKHMLNWQEYRFEKRLVLLSPRGHMKSTLFSHLFRLHDIYCNPNITMIIGRKTVHESENRSISPLLKAIEQNPQVGIKPGKPWGESGFSVQRDIINPDMTVKPIGVHDTSIGAHPHWIILDDIIDGTEGDNELNKIEVWIQRVLLPFAMKGTYIQYINTNKGANDIAMRLLKTGMWRSHVERAVLKYPSKWEYVENEHGQRVGVNILSDYGEVFANDCFSMEYLLMKKGEMTEPLFEMEYNNDPSKMNAGYIHNDWLRYYTWSEDGTILSTKQIGDIALKNLSVVLGVDLAYTEKTSSDWTVICVLGFDDHRNIFVLDMFLGKTKSPNTQIEWLKKMYDTWKASLVCMGDVAAEKLMNQQVVEMTSMHIIPRKRRTSIGKAEHFRMMALNFETGKVYLDERWKKKWNSFKDVDRNFDYPLSFRDELIGLPDVPKDDCSDAYEYAESGIPQIIHFDGNPYSFIDKRERNTSESREFRSARRSLKEPEDWGRRQW